MKTDFDYLMEKTEECGFYQGMLTILMQAAKDSTDSTVLNAVKFVERRIEEKGSYTKV